MGANSEQRLFLPIHHKKSRFYMITLWKPQSFNLILKYLLFLCQVAQGDEIRLYNSGGEVAGSTPGQDIHFHFVGVLLYSHAKN
jgi:hypothetical protein